MNRLEEFKTIAYEVYDDYGWILDRPFDNINKVDEYKQDFIKEFTRHFCLDLNDELYEDVSDETKIISRMQNV